MDEESRKKIKLLNERIESLEASMASILDTLKTEVKYMNRILENL